MAIIRRPGKKSRVRVSRGVAASKRPPPASIQRCPHCKKWEPKGALKAHVIEYHPEKAIPITIKGEHSCSFCTEHCTTEASLHAHLSRKHFACFKCHSSWSSREELVDHWLSTRHVEYCQSCDGGFSNFQKYNAHLCPRRRIAHTQAPSEPRTCPVCRMTAPDEEIFKEHWENMHADWIDPQQPAHCGDCNMKFKNLELLTAHHWKEKACTKCHLHHKTVNGLRQHMRTHGAARHKCLFCYAPFPELSGMLRHVEVGGCPSGRGASDLTAAVARVEGHEYYMYCAERVLSGKPIGRGEKMYYCQGGEIDCDRDFESLSGFFEHMEHSERCDQGLGDKIVEPLVRALHAS